MKISAGQRERNRSVRSEMRREIKELGALTNRDEAMTKYNLVTSILDKAASKGVIHKKNADRKKSRLAHFVAKLG